MRSEIYDGHQVYLSKGNNLTKIIWEIASTYWGMLFPGTGLNLNQLSFI